MTFTAALLRQATGCTAEAAERFAEPLRAACAFYSIDTAPRLAAFLAQIGHESMSLRYTSELWGPTAAQLTYEGRANLGNTQPGDGERFKGHGLVQITGRANHARVRDRLRERFPDVPNFEFEPEALTEPQWAALSAADYWDEHGCNALADAGDFLGITRKINGGLNGLADRQARLARAQAALLPMPQPAADRPAAVDLARPAAIPSITKPPKEPAMVIPIIAAVGAAVLPDLLKGLANSLINVFSPLAREKINAEMARHTDSPEVAAQLTNNIIETAKALTGKDDPIDAVAAAKAEPDIVHQVEANALDTLDRLAPLLDKMAGWDREAWAASEASFDAAAQRARGDANDQDVFLTRSIVGIVVGLLVAMVALLAVMVWLKASEGTIGTVLGLLSMAVGVAFGEFKGRYQHRYGSSRSSAAKDVMIGELSRRKP